MKSENKIIAAARLSFHAQAISVPDYEWLTPMHSVLIEPCVSLNRLVVDSEFRGRGIARKLDCIRLNHADKKLAKTVHRESMDKCRHSASSVSLTLSLQVSLLRVSVTV